MGKRLKVPLSAARSNLFELADIVRQSGDDTAVVFEHRGSRDHVVLVREARLAYLETRVRELEDRQPEPFTLAGSLTSDLDDSGLEQALRDIRGEWVSGSIEPAPRSRKKMRRSRG